MNHSGIYAMAASMALAAAAPGAVQAVDVSTDGGLAVASDDGAYTFELGGRAMWDADSFDGVLNQEHDGDRRFDGYLRRARIEMSGTFPGEFGWVFDVNVNDRGSKDAEIHAAGLEYTGFALADVFIGRNKEPFGLEELASSKALSTIERNYFTEATDTDSQSHYGVRADGRAGPVGWSLGVFNPGGNPTRDDGGDRLAVTGRVFGTPYETEERLLHLGIAYSDRNIDDPVEASGFRLDIAEGGGELDSSTLLIDADRQLGLEALYLQGPFSLQSEYFRRDMPGANGGPDGEVTAFYLQGTWTVTGESRGYKAGEGIPGMIEPAGSRGAMELVAKFDRIEFAVDGRPDQEVDGFLVGANWYPNGNVKFMFNAIRVDSDALAAPGADDGATVFSTRVQFAF